MTSVKRADGGASMRYATRMPAVRELASRPHPMSPADATSSASIHVPVPVASGERIHALDILRGFALWGMIVVHFHQRVHTEATGVEGLIGWVVWIGIEAKSWGTFAFLFGVGFAVLLRRLEARGTKIGAFYLRRLFVLALFGVVAEAAFGFSILLEYAMWGVPLLALRRLGTRSLLLIALIAAMANPVITAGAALHWWPSLVTPEAAATVERAHSAVQAAGREGGFVPLVAARLALMRVKYFAVPTLIPGATFVLFILGMLALRSGMIDAPRRHVRSIAAWMAFGFACWGLYWSVLFQIPDGRFAPIDWQVRYGFGILNEQWLCLTFVGAIVLLLAFRAEWRSRLAWFGSAGRMALTNYMLQIAALDFIVSGYGLSLRVRPAVGVLAAAALFGVEVAFSRWWLARYRFGPCEWVWRSLTYGQRQPMRRAAIVPDAAA